MALDRKEPVYAIGVVARMVGVHQQTLRNYERWGLVIPCRSSGGSRLYSQEDLDRIQQIREWVDDLGINLAGVEVMTRLLSRIRELEGQLDDLTAEVVRLRDGSPRLPG